jgi:hypothetical protein
MIRKLIFIPLALVASVVVADMHRLDITGTANTNTTATGIATNNQAKGLIYRVSAWATQSATNASGAVTNFFRLLDGDGSVIASNSVIVTNNGITSATFTTNYATAVPFVGLVIDSRGAFTNVATTTITVEPTWSQP